MALYIAVVLTDESMPAVYMINLVGMLMTYAPVSTFNIRRPSIETIFFPVHAGFGLASHLGVLADIPCVGVGKKLYHVDGLQKGPEHKQKVFRDSLVFHT